MVGVVVVACQRMEPPVPLVLNMPGASQCVRPPGHGPTAIVVRKGDTLYAVARRYKVSVKAVIITNQLQPPFLLRAGQSLTLPSQKIHVVEKGDTLYGIARVYDVEVPLLARTNGLSSPYKLLIGQALSIPAPLRRLPVTSSAPVAGKMEETLSAGSAGPDRSRGREAEEHPAGIVTVEPLPLLPRGGGPPQASPPVVPPRVPAESTSPARPANANLPKPPRRSGQPLLWPVTGKMLSRYGALGDGTHHDGINIAAPRGTPVRAADNGVVVYVGNELKNFGNLLLIRHADNLLTAYAHHDTILVRRGDTVKRGQIVGTVGATGGVNAPQLHFEVRQGVKAVDPVPYLS